MSEQEDRQKGDISKSKGKSTHINGGIYISGDSYIGGGSFFGRDEADEADQIKLERLLVTVEDKYRVLWSQMSSEDMEDLEHDVMRLRKMSQDLTLNRKRMERKVDNIMDIVKATNLDAGDLMDVLRQVMDLVQSPG